MMTFLGWSPTHVHNSYFLRRGDHDKSSFLGKTTSKVRKFFAMLNYLLSKKLGLVNNLEVRP